MGAKERDSLYKIHGVVQYVVGEDEEVKDESVKTISRNQFSVSRKYRQVELIGSE